MTIAKTKSENERTKLENTVIRGRRAAEYNRDELAALLRDKGVGHPHSMSWFQLANLCVEYDIK